MIAVQGLQEIKDFVNGLPKELSHKVMQTVNAEAAQPMVARIHLLAPVGKTGNLADSIGVEKPNIKRTTEIGMVHVGPRRSSKHRGFHAHLVEYGTKDRVTKDGVRTGVMPKQPFIKPAFDQMSGSVLNNINNILGRRVVQFAKRKIKATGGTWLKV
jgi:HK97 gp10 family phage protein